MSNNTEQSDLSIVFTDQEQNYYVVPLEVLERGRVPAERKAEVEEALHEHRDDVSGHLLVVLVAAGLVGSAAVGGTAGAAGFAVGAAATYTGVKAAQAIMS